MENQNYHRKRKFSFSGEKGLPDQPIILNWNEINDDKKRKTDNIHGQRRSNEHIGLDLL